MSTGQAEATVACPRCSARNEPRARFCGDCGASLWPSMPPTERQAAPTRTVPAPPREPHFADPLLGLVIAERYRVLELIGRGGMGVVYKAEHSRIGKVLALKLLTGEISRHSDQVLRFKREALMASRLSHPNTVQVFDFGDADGLAYLAMEYVRGVNLGDLVEQAGPLGVERTAKIVIQVCSSLAEAHEKGIVHRDLKPENIMVVKSPADDDIAKVLDFGLAKLRESSELSDVTLSGAIVGTPYYMAPEQIRGESVGSPADVYALGAVMYACLTGTLVFDAPTPMGVLTRHLLEEPEPPSRRSPASGVSKSMDQIVLTALAKDPSKRFQTAIELQEALLAELRGASNQSGVELLLDRSRLRSLVGGDDDAATRDEVERYERKLRRRGHVTWAVLGLFVAGLLAGAVHAYDVFTRAPVFEGREIEPNDAASTALAVPFPLDARGRIGQRIDRERSDRDFYRLSVPPGNDAVRLTLEPLPNMALCAWLFPGDAADPFGRYCSGAVGQRLDIPVLELGQGSWVLAVMQDREAYYEGAAPPVYENVSDDYRLIVAPAHPSPERESEPNDEAPRGNSIAPGASLRGSLAWVRDRDLYCLAPGAERARFVVEDAIERPRARGVVLRVTQKSGPERDVPVRVHRAGAAVKASARDVLGVWRGPLQRFDAAAPACIELTLDVNPWGPTPLPILAQGGSEEYLIRVEAE